MKRVTLPWPPKELKPNSREHWAVKGRAAAKHKADCQYAAMAAGIRALGWSGMAVDLEFCPPSARRADLDNMLAAMKHGLDGLAAAAGVDDSLWTITIRKGAPVKGGAVNVGVRNPAASEN